MEFTNEKDLQSFIASTFRARGDEQVEREAKTDTGHYLDVLTSQYAIEVKPYLTRTAITQAGGQLLAYEEFFSGGKRIPVIAGIAPEGAAARATADNYAELYMLKHGIQVWYVDEIPDFVEAYESFKQWGEVVLAAEPEVFDPEPRQSNPTWWFALAGLATVVLMLSYVSVPSFEAPAAAPGAQIGSPAKRSHSQSETGIIIGAGDFVPAQTSSGPTRIPVGIRVNIRERDGQYITVRYQNQDVEIKSAHLR